MLVSVTLYVPGVLYVTVGFCTVDVAGVPPGKLHDHDVGLPVLRSVKFTVMLLQPLVGVPLKLATGALMLQLPLVRAIIAVGPQEFVITALLIMSLPPAVSLVAVSVTLSVLAPMFQCITDGGDSMVCPNWWLCPSS